MLPKSASNPAGVAPLPTVAKLGTTAASAHFDGIVMPSSPSSSGRLHRVHPLWPHQARHCALGCATRAYHALGSYADLCTDYIRLPCSCSRRC
eukprot:scaffold67089_cov24-Phaeocystis_antarctica.AAC.1